LVAEILAQLVVLTLSTNNFARLPPAVSRITTLQAGFPIPS
jgi:hypothetical protein